MKIKLIFPLLILLFILLIANCLEASGTRMVSFVNQIKNTDIIIVGKVLKTYGIYEENGRRLHKFFSIIVDKPLLGQSPHEQILLFEYSVSYSQNGPVVLDNRKYIFMLKEIEIDFKFLRESKNLNSYVYSVSAPSLEIDPDSSLLCAKDLQIQNAPVYMIAFQRKATYDFEDSEYKNYIQDVLQFYNILQMKNRDEKLHSLQDMMKLKRYERLSGLLWKDDNHTILTAEEIIDLYESRLKKEQ